VPKTDLLQGTLDLLLLRILALGPNHGWGISNRIRQTSGDGLHASQGSLYPALHRLELRGDVRSEMKPSENKRLPAGADWKLNKRAGSSSLSRCGVCSTRRRRSRPPLEAEEPPHVEPLDRVRPRYRTTRKN
jgi:hypothetical protein